MDATTLSEIWDTHADRLLIVARSIGEPAEDAVQEAFLKLAEQDQVPEDPMAWLVRVARNCLLQWYRSKQRRRKREALVSPANWFSRDDRSVEQRLDADLIASILMKLDSPCREVIVMRLWGEMSFDAIASVIGSSRATVHRDYYRGLEQIKKRFDKVSNKQDGRPQADDSVKLCL